MKTKTVQKKQKDAAPAMGASPLRPALVAVEEHCAKAGYEAYCQSRGWRAYDGQPLPAWADVRTDIKISWMKAAEAIAEALLNDLYAV